MRAPKRRSCSDGVNPQRTATFAAVLLDLFEAAKLEVGRAACFRLAHAGLHLVRYLRVEMKAKFGIEFLLHPASPQESL